VSFETSFILLPLKYLWGGTLVGNRHFGVTHIRLKERVCVCVLPTVISLPLTWCLHSSVSKRQRSVTDLCTRLFSSFFQQWSTLCTCGWRLIKLPGVFHLWVRVHFSVLWKIVRHLWSQTSHVWIKKVYYFESVLKEWSGFLMCCHRKWRLWGYRKGLLIIILYYINSI